MYKKSLNTYIIVINNLKWFNPIYNYFSKEHENINKFAFTLINIEISYSLI